MAVQKKTDSWKMKKWFTAYAPKSVGESVIGEFPANDEEAAIGRNIVVGLDVITHNPSHAYTNAVLKVTDVNGSVAHTKLMEIRQLYSYIRSLVRRYRSVASLVTPVTSKDGRNMNMKLLVITRSRVTHSRIRGIRKEMETEVLSYVKEKDEKDIISTIIDGSFQAQLAAKLKHITPINRIEVRTLEFK